MPVLFYESTHSAALLFAAVGGALAIIAACIVVLYRARIGLLGFVLSVLVFLSTIAGTSLAWTFLRYAATTNHNRERAFELRVNEIKAQALAPGSPFACLDPSIGETIQNVCEHDVFASAATVAAEISYVWSEYTLVSDVAADSVKSANDFESAIISLRRSLEADRFGFLAYLLEIRDGCTSANCPALAVLKDPVHVRLNIAAHTLDQYVANYRQSWATQETAARAEVSSYQPAPQKRKFVDINFPSAASIPPIHIMTPDTGAPGAPGKVHPSGPASAKNPSLPSVLPRTQATLSSRFGGAGDPVWTPGSSLAATGSKFLPSSSAPVQPSPNASPAAKGGQ